MRLKIILRLGLRSQPPLFLPIAATTTNGSSFFLHLHFYSSPASTRMHPMLVMTLLMVLATWQPSPTRRSKAGALLSHFGRRNGLKQK